MKEAWYVHVVCCWPKVSARYFHGTRALSISPNHSMTKEYVMMKAIFGLILAVTAAQAWDPLASVPEPAAVEAGACITYGADGIWGIFPSSDSDQT